MEAVRSSETLEHTKALGGDPLFESTRDEITALAKEIRENFPNKTIWVYTGFKFDDVKGLEIMGYIDVLVDGKFVLAEKDTKLHFRGSKHQNIIDVKKSLEKNQLSLLEV